MKLAFASDHAAFELKNELIEFARSEGYEVQDFGTHSLDSCDYPDFAFAAAKSVSEGESDRGVVICGSGIGMSIVCNKVKGIRSANCQTVEMAELSRLHNNANILNMGARLINTDDAKQILLKFLTTEFEGGRHNRRVDKIHNLTGV